MSTRVQQLKDEIGKLLNEAAALKAKADELLALAAKMKEEKEVAEVQWPKVAEGCRYFLSVMSDGDTAICSNEGFFQHEELYRRGNYFLTEEDAGYYSKLWAARQRFDRMAEVVNGGKLMKNVGVCFTIVADNEHVFVVAKYRPYSGMPTFRTMEAAQRCLDAMSAEDKSLLFGVP